MVVSDFTSRKIFLDSAPLIYFIEGNSEYQPLLQSLFESAEKGRFSFVTSAITLLEVMVKPLREGQKELAAQYRDILTSASGMELLSITPLIAEQAAQLRAAYQLKTPDAIQLAASIDRKADYFLTNDIRLKVVSEVPVVTLDEFQF